MRTILLCGVSLLLTCGGSGPPPPDMGPLRDLRGPADFSNPVDFSTPLNYAAIQRDEVSLSCTAIGCHDKNASTRLKIDTTPGQEMANYQLLFSQNLVIKGDAASSELIKVPSTGMNGSPPVSHVKTLTGVKLMNWQMWINNQAPF
jgi:hypothetical protein